MKTLLCFISTSLIILLSGCSTIFGDNGRSVQVNSSPQNATVYANNQPVGNTPLTLHVPNTWSPTLLTFRKPGYAVQTAQVNTAFQPIGILNILFWPGFVIDAISGDMMKISPESRIITANLSRA